MKLAILLAAHLMIWIVTAQFAPARAQSREMIAALGMRLLVPSNWEWQWRDRNEILINCAPEITDRFGCSLIVTVLNARPDQAAITDADRKQWRSWQSASGIRRIIATRDRRVAGYPAYEIISEDPLRIMRLLVLAPRLGRVYDIEFAAGTPANRNAEFHRRRPAAEAVLQTLTIFAE